MKSYKNFEVEDFISDEYFIDSVRCPDQETELFWTTWLAENSERRQAFEQARRIIEAITISPTHKQLTDYEVKHLVEDFQRNTEAPKKTRLWSIGWLSAAAAISLIGVFILFQKKPAEVKQETAAVESNGIMRVTNTGSSTRLIRLSDQSVVLLRPKSSINYPSNFAGNIREVTLVGEAFFEVRKDPDHPFYVRGGDMVTKVLGTSFDVVAPADGNESSVVVKTGKVQVFHTKKNADQTQQLDSVVLMPNQKVVFNLKKPKLEKLSIVKPLMLSPLEADKVFSFKNAPLSEIVSKLQQAYAVEITYDEKKFEGYTITASLSKLPLEEKVRAICKSIDADYQFEDNQIRIY